MLGLGVPASCDGGATRTDGVALTQAGALQPRQNLLDEIRHLGEVIEKSDRSASKAGFAHLDDLFGHIVRRADDGKAAGKVPGYSLPRLRLLASGLMSGRSALVLRP